MSYILSANVNRRSLTKGQRAMAVARLSKLEDSFKQSAAADAAGVQESRISEARSVLRYAPELAEAVMAGTVPLNDAYAEAKQRKEAKASREEQAKRDARDLALLRASAPDLADLVADERMSLREAMATWRYCYKVTPSTNPRQLVTMT